MPRTHARLLLAGLAVIISACSKDGLGLVPVSGHIAFQEGQQPDHGTVYFRPKETAPGLPLRPAFGNFTADGDFQVKSFKPNDGLVPGTYSVMVECFKKSGSSWERGEFEAEDLVVEPGASDIEVEYDASEMKYQPYRGM